MADEVTGEMSTEGELHRWLEADIATDALWDFFGPESSGKGEPYPRVASTRRRER